ncbi:MAG: S41 family peptidase [Lachnospiraceae bacterium]|nr:S41 family peptidase [Lachnospiraceae bacterium]
MKKFSKLSISAIILLLILGGCALTPYTGSTTTSGDKFGTHNQSRPSSGFFGGTSGGSLEVNEKIDYINGLIDDKFYFDVADDEEREEYLYKGLLESLDDPYSVYYTADEYNDMMTTSTGSYEGIGVSIQQDPETKILTIIRVFKGSGAEEAGVLPNDIIMSVNGRELNGEDVSEVVSWIRGEPGTTVDITFYRPSTKEELPMTIERRKIDNSTVTYAMKENHIGYIEVTDFYEATSEQFSMAIDDLLAQGMTGLIIDLRNNPGGYVRTAVEMCDRILADGLIVYTEDRDGNILEQYSTTDDVSLDIPIVVLVNGNSASASEIFAGCMKDYGKATLVGTVTYGKGIVQQVIPLEDGSAVKLTIAKYFTPNGNDIHKIGIEPDVVVELPDDLKNQSVVPEDQDTQLQKAMELLR